MCPHGGAQLNIPFFGFDLFCCVWGNEERNELKRNSKIHFFLSKMERKRKRRKNECKFLLFLECNRIAAVENEEYAAE